MIILHNFIEIDEVDQKRIKDSCKSFIFRHKNDFKTLVRLNAWEINEIASALKNGYDKHLCAMFHKLSQEAFRELREKNL